MAFTERGSMSHEVERTLRTIFRRCLQCPDTTPSCPTCNNNEICSLVPTTCTACAYATCIANPSPAPKSSGPNIGAIAGGVVGGVAVVAIIVFCIWRFWIKKRREQQEREMEMEAEEWEEDDIAQQKATHQFDAMQADAASTRTRGSFANSILSRASNIIQIAYIPGVTNRNGGSGHNSLLGNAPVPPIPAAMRGSQPPKSPLSNEGDMLFFRPADLRDSSYSATSSLASGNRDTRYTRHSITPSLARSSMASDAFRESTVEIGPMPATSVARAAPRMVSIRSATSGSSGDSTGSQSPPPTATGHQDFAPGGKGKGMQIMMPGEGAGPSPSSSLRGKAKQVTVGGGGGGAVKSRFPVRQASDASTLTAASGKSRHAPVRSSPLAALEDVEDEDGDEDDEDVDEHARARQSLIHESLTQAAQTPPLIQPIESPFFDASEHPPSAASGNGRVPNPYASMAASVGRSLDDRPKRGGKGMGALSDIIEEGMKRASRVPSHEGLGGVRDVSPFGDQHAMQ